MQVLRRSAFFNCCRPSSILETVYRQRLRVDASEKVGDMGAPLVPVPAMPVRTCVMTDGPIQAHAQNPTVTATTTSGLLSSGLNR